jgi:hypothetical protein
MRRMNGAMIQPGLSHSSSSLGRVPRSRPAAEGASKPKQSRVTDSRGVKAAHLQRDPRASVVVCEHSPPYRGAEVRCVARLVTAGVEDAVARIASRYLGREAGATYSATSQDDLLIRLEAGRLRAWDFADEVS